MGDTDSKPNNYVIVDNSIYRCLHYMGQKCRRLLILLLSLLPTLSGISQEANIFSTLSPNLRRFIESHEGAAKILNQVLSEAFAKERVEIYYFYSTNEPNAFQFYKETNVVSIAIRQDQQPLDEFICLTYEALNSENENAFVEIFKRAKLGTISKLDFAHEILKQEFKAEKRLQMLMGNLKFHKAETSKAISYKRLLACPDTFESDLAKIERAATSDFDPVRYYEKEYEDLRK